MELLMRNGSHSNKLTLINSSTSGHRNDTDVSAAYSPYQPESTVFADESGRAQKTFFVFLAISIACAAATIGTGSYAAWLSRQQAARQTLTDVDEILKSCQSRMSQLEADLQRLPHHPT
jgi:cytochrome c-type biogenesis protein CcmH/NrfG